MGLKPVYPLALLNYINLPEVFWTYSSMKSYTPQPKSYLPFRLFFRREAVVPDPRVSAPTGNTPVWHWKSENKVEIYLKLKQVHHKISREIRPLAALPPPPYIKVLYRAFFTWGCMLMPMAFAPLSIVSV